MRFSQFLMEESIVWHTATTQITLIETDEEVAVRVYGGSRLLRCISKICYEEIY